MVEGVSHGGMTYHAALLYNTDNICMNWYVYLECICIYVNFDQQVFCMTVCVRNMFTALLSVTHSRVFKGMRWLKLLLFLFSPPCEHRWSSLQNVHSLRPNLIWTSKNVFLLNTLRLSLFHVSCYLFCTRNSWCLTLSSVSRCLYMETLWKYTLKNEGSLLASTVPWRTFKGIVHPKWKFDENVLTLRPSKM